MENPVTTYTQKQAFVDHHMHVPGMMLLTVGLAAIFVAASYLGASKMKDGLRMTAASQAETIRYTGLGLMAASCLGIYLIHRNCRAPWKARRQVEQGLLTSVYGRNVEDEAGLRRVEWVKATEYALVTLLLGTLGAMCASGWTTNGQDMVCTEGRLYGMLGAGLGLAAIGTGFIVYGVHRHRKCLQVYGVQG